MTKKETVRQYRDAHPHESHREMAKALGLSKNMVSYCCFCLDNPDYYSTRRQAQRKIRKGVILMNGERARPGDAWETRECLKCQQPFDVNTTKHDWHLCGWCRQVATEAVTELQVTAW